jgi:hypothetical protein
MDGSTSIFSVSGCPWLVATVLVLLLAPCVSPATTRVNQDDSTDDQGYDQIVNDLNRQVDRPAALSRAKMAQQPSEAFDSILFHGGVGVSALSQTLTFDNGKQVYVGQKGMQIAFGIDLFSPNWLAEGTYRNFAQTDDSSTRVALQEFEMKVFYRDRIEQQIGYRVGGGLSARYMTISQPGITSEQYTTPAGVGTLGLEFYLSEKISLGIDLSGRSAMISETPDKNSIDGTLRVAAHF